MEVKQIDKAFFKSLSGFTGYPREILILQREGENVVYSSLSQTAWISWPTHSTDVKLRIVKYLPTNYGTFVELPPTVSWNELVFTSFPRTRTTYVAEMFFYDSLPRKVCDLDTVRSLLSSDKGSYVPLTELGIDTVFSVFAPPFRKLAPLLSYGVEAVYHSFGSYSGDNVFGLILTFASGLTMHAYATCVCFPEGSKR